MLSYLKKTVVQMIELINWIPVKDQLPDDETTVMIYSAKHDEPVWFGFYEANAWFLPDGMPLLAKPTHWADMPAGPDQQTNKTMRVNAWNKQGLIMAQTPGLGDDDSNLNATLILDDGVVL
jgi:hypothetical protein